MAIGRLFNLARMTTATTGTGTLTLGSAVSGYLSFSGAGVSNGDIVSYGIIDGSNSEVGTGTYTSSGTTLTRTVIASTNSGSAISLSGSAEVFITALANNILPAQTTAVQMILNSMANARAAGVAHYGGMSFADSFGATTYVDTAGATALDTGTAGLLKNTATAGSDQTATHTSATTGGNTVTESTVQVAGTEGWRVFDKGTQYPNDYWQTNSVTTGWLKYQFGTAKTIASYTITPYPGLTDRAPKTWTLQGSNDNSSWTTLDTRTNYTSWTGGTPSSFTISSPASYTYYKLDVTANNGGSLLLILEMTLKSADTPNNLTVASNSIALASVPATIIPVVRIKHVDSATAGTDYNLYVSRDGGTTYSSAASLTDWGVDPFETNVHIVYGAPVDVSGQPSGSNLRLKIITSNNKSLEVRDWGVVAYQ